MSEGLDFVRIHRLREYLGWLVARFNAVLESLRRNYLIELHGGNPAAFSHEQRAASYEDAHGQRYLTLSWREVPPGLRGHASSAAINNDR